MGIPRLPVALPLLVLVACGPTTPPPEPQPAPVEPAPAPATHGAPEAPPPAPPPVDPLAGLDADARWAWAVGVMPRIAELTRAPAASFTPLRAKDGSYVLYSPDLHELEGGAVPFHAPPCARIELREEQGVLVTRLPEKAGAAGPDTKPSYVGLRLGERLELGPIVTAGAEDTPLGFASGSAGPPWLAELTPDRIRYEHAGFGRAVACQTRVVNRMCTDGTKSTCTSCSLTLVDTPRHGKPGSTVVLEPQSACEPCPPDDRTPLVEPLSRVLAEHRVVNGSEGGFSFYRDKKACSAARRAVPGPVADREVHGFPQHPDLVSVCSQHMTLAGGAHLQWSLYATDAEPGAVAAWYRPRVAALVTDNGTYSAKLPSAAKPEQILEIAPVGTPGPDCGQAPPDTAKTIVRFSRMTR